MRWAAWGLTSQGKIGDFKAIIWIFFFKENHQLCNLMQTVSGIFALKDAVGRNRSQNPFRPLLPDFYYCRALTANTASKLAISVTMAIKWVRFPSIMTWIVRTLQRARASAQGSYGGKHSGENSYFNSLRGVEDPRLLVHIHVENYHQTVSEGADIVPGRYSAHPNIHSSHPLPTHPVPTTGLDGFMACRILVPCRPRKPGRHGAPETWQARGKGGGSNPEISKLFPVKDWTGNILGFKSCIILVATLQRCLCCSKAVTDTMHINGQVYSSTVLLMDTEIWILNTFQCVMKQYYSFDFFPLS